MSFGGRRYYRRSQCGGSNLDVILYDFIERGGLLMVFSVHYRHYGARLPNRLVSKMYNRW